MFHVLARRSVIGFLCLWFDLRWALIVCCGAVPTDSTYPPIDIRSPEAVICSEITSSSTEKHPWCEIKWNPDKDSAMIRNLRFVVGMHTSRKRPHLLSNDDNNEMARPCPQCGNLPT
ncbi:hypothetical protein B296_00027088 [Ensete ventricosum]|uniref:Secreted protein n=1 Tax=Ensete ventricosum TaxID=4639 RepID=A0A427AH58_ENSVE|nr:hypothetical protein B296_00027088 [Ensete ventricosum]